MGKLYTEAVTFDNLSNFNKIFNIMSLVAPSFLNGWMTFYFMSIPVQKLDD